MRNPTADFEQELKKLQQQYARSLPDKMKAIAADWVIAHEAGWREAVVETLYRSVHNLAGGAGLYGFPEISDAARALMALLQPWMQRPDAPDGAVQAQLEEAFDTLQRVLSEADVASRPKPAPSVSVATRPGIPPPNEAACVVYVVEDDADQLRFLRHVLEQAGYQVEGFERLDLLRQAAVQAPPFAVIMDMMFPEGDLAGARAILDLRQHVDRPLPVIFISARDDLEARLSAVRAGATYYFTKPLNVGSLIDALNRLIRGPVQKDARILLVDDDPEVGEYYAACLEDAGIMARTLSNPFQLLEALDLFKPNLILLDLFMPNIDGFEVAAVIRQHEVHFDTPIVLLTKETSLQVRARALDLACDDFLEKGMRPEEFVKAVTKRLELMERYARMKKAALWSPPN